MSFPSSVGTKQDDLETAWQQIRRSAGFVKQMSQNVSALSAAGPMSAFEIVNYSLRLADAMSALARYTQVSGLAAYVKEQIGDANIDIVAEYNTMLAQMQATRDWVIANFPKDASGYLLYQQFDADGRIVTRNLSVASTAGFRTVLASLVATIN